VLHGELHEKASLLAQEHGVRATGSIVEGQEEAIFHYLREESADLLVIGLHQHDFYLSRLGSSVYDLAQDTPCSVLGVHWDAGQNQRGIPVAMGLASEALRHE
jgi:nucleotide-binding universal stress UspA family protein